ncbi:MAG TPA: hypothetical protein VMZ90_08455 [Vicinamibacterales bacterium]|nr:hypothetical protein [Vicinamibacterales bacterium]
MRGPGLLVGIGLVLVLATATIGTPADADLWGHITFGRDIVMTGQIIQADPYSFTSDRAWVNHEWVAEVIFAEVYRRAGSTGLVAFKVLIIATLFALLWRHVRRTGASASVAATLLALAFVGTFWRTHTIRPQLFSVLFFAILLITMTRVDEGRRWTLLLLPPLMAIWVNVHGGWIVGLGVLGFWTAVRIVTPGIALNARLQLAVAGIAAVAATLLNPYGADLWRFLGETVRLGRSDIEEWGSVLTYPGPLGVPWALTLTAAGLAVWRSGRPRRWDYVALAGLLAFASFRVSRLDAFFALAVVILLLPELTSLAAHILRRRRAAPTAEPTQPALGIIVITVIAVAAMLVPAAKIIGPYATCLTIAGAWVPDEQAGRFILQNRLRGRMLTWFDWGEYAIWHFGPDLQVSMDGRRETVYTEGTIRAHRQFYAADETASSYLRALNPDYIWLPRHLAITATLESAGWTAAFDGPVSVVLARAGAGPFEQVAKPGGGMRCFPGP